MSVRVEKIIIALLLFAALILSVFSMRTINETTDEVPHIAAGYTYLLKADFRLNVEHPPLVKELSALPLLILGPKFNDNDWYWNHSLAWDVGKLFLYTWNKPERIVFWARMPIIALYLGLGLLLWYAARRLYGPLAGIIALLFALYTPELIAHGQLVTTDLGMALFTFSAVWFCYRSLSDWHCLDIALCSISCGCVAATKFTAPIVFAILLVIALFYVFLGQILSDLKKAPSLPKRAGRAGLLALIAIAGTLIILWAVYGFRYAISPDVEILVPWENFDGRRLITQIILFFREWRILPEAYLAGILECFKMLPDRPSYFLGQVLTGGRWTYFPVTFLLKTPLPLMILLLFGFLSRRKESRVSFSSLILLAPVAIFLLVTMQSDINIGNRHILPIYPFLIVWATASVESIDPANFAHIFRVRYGEKLSQWIQWRTIVLATLCVWLLLGAIRIYPNYLSYFNELAGGPSGGSRYLADSNNDWGQNLSGLANYARQHINEKIYLCYSGSADPSYYLPTATVLPCLVGSRGPAMAVPSGSIVAISQNALVGSYLRSEPEVRGLVESLRRLTPIAQVGYSIFLYRLP